jgi:hypothetical protein
MYKRSVQYTLMTCTLVIIVAALAPVLFPFAWHLIHRKSQYYAGYVISVPGRFILLKSQNRARLVSARTVFSNQVYKFELIEMHQGNRVVDIEAWRKEALMAMIQKKYTNVQSFDISAANIPTTCVERSQDNPEVATIVYCKNSSGLVIQYFGDRAGVSQLLEILRNLNYSNSK